MGSMADSGGRWWSDRIANKKRRRLGYHDQVKQEGPLPRVRDDSARISGAKSYKPNNNWSPSKALAGQNDYIDILGSEDLHPKHLLYHVPKYLKGVHRNEKHFQIQLRRQKALEHTKFPDAYPSKWQGWRLTTLQNHPAKLWPAKMIILTSLEVRIFILAHLPFLHLLL